MPHGQPADALMQGLPIDESLVYPTLRFMRIRQEWRVSPSLGRTPAGGSQVERRPPPMI